MNREISISYVQYCQEKHIHLPMIISLYYFVYSCICFSSVLYNNRGGGRDRGKEREREAEREVGNGKGKKDGERVGEEKRKAEQSGEGVEKKGSTRGK